MPGNRHGRNDAVILGHCYPLANGTGCRLFALSCGLRLDRVTRPTIRRDDRIQFTPLGLRERDSEAVVYLIARLGQHSRHDARPERSAVNADASSDLHALALPIRKNRYNEALVAVDE